MIIIEIIEEIKQYTNMGHLLFSKLYILIGAH